MMRNRTLTAWLLIVMTLAVPAAAEQARATLTAQDYAEIQQLYYKYHWLVDAVDGPAWAQLFTPDGSYQSGGATGYRATGHEELARLVVKAMNGGPLTTNPLGLITNIWIEPAGDGTARGGAYLVRINPGEGDTLPTINGVTIYEDILVKTPEGWRLKSRKSHGGPDIGLEPSRQVKARSAK